MRSVPSIKPVAGLAKEKKCVVTVSSRGTKEYLCGERRGKIGGAMARVEDTPRILKERQQSAGPLSILQPKRRIEAELKLKPTQAQPGLYVSSTQEAKEQDLNTPFPSKISEATEKLPSSIHLEEEEEAKERKFGKSLIKSMAYLQTYGDRVLHRKISLKSALDKVPWWMQDDLLEYLRDKKKRGRKYA
jgi:hypothetical protein